MSFNSGKWNYYSISEVCSSVSSGGTPSRNKKQYWTDGTINWLKTKELNDNIIYGSEEKINAEGLDNSSAKLFPPKTIIMAIYAAPTLGKLGLLAIESSTNQACAGLMADENKINHLFLYYSLLYNRPKLQKLGNGAAQQNINLTILKNYEILVPSLEIQEQISDILFSLDTKIQLNTQMNATLEAIGQALFKRWFVDFEFPDENGNPYRSSGGEMTDSELGPIPKGWEVGKLSSYISITKGCSYSSEYLSESKNALLGLKCIERGGGFKEEGLKEYSGSYKKEHVVNIGDLVIAHTDLTQNAEVIGKPALVRKTKYENLVASLDVGIVRILKKLNVYYLYYLLKSDNFQNHAYGYCTGTTVLHLNKKALPEYVVAIPDEYLLSKFEMHISSIYSIIHKNYYENNSLCSIRDALLPKLMSGEIRVPVEEVSAP